VHKYFFIVCSVFILIIFASKLLWKKELRKENIKEFEKKEREKPQPAPSLTPPRPIPSPPPPRRPICGPPSARSQAAVRPFSPSG
jgi:hypothetical protein